MCNLWSLNKTREEIRFLMKALRDFGSNAPLKTQMYPDYSSPVVRIQDGERIMSDARWGLPSSQKALLDAATKRADKLRAKGKPVDFDQLLKMEPDGGTTNVRNTASKHWKRWLGPANRCLVPMTAFAEPTRLPDGRTGNAWFAVDESKPLVAFAGIWLPQWTSVRKVKEGETTNDLYAFLTTEPNKEVGEIHQKAMPVILTNEQEWQTWLTAEWDDAQHLQRPLPNGSLKVLSVEPYGRS